MSRSGQDMAQQTFKQSQGAANTASANAGSLYSTLVPQFTQEATHPNGIAPTDLAAMNTAAQQSAGGALSAAKGEAGLQAARDRNRGGYQGAVAESARDAMRTGSQRALGVQNENTQAKLNERQEGLSGLSSAYGQNLSSLANSLGQQTGATNSYVNAGQSGWFQNMLGFINAASNAGSAAAGFKG